MPARKRRAERMGQQNREPHTFKIPRDLFKKLQHYAIDHDLEYSEVLETALRQFLEDKQPPNK